MKKIELVAPAGSFDNLLTALKFGADAVYFGPGKFSLRAGSEDFSGDNLVRAISTVKEQSKKAYITLNAIHSNREINEIEKFIEELKGLEVDGVIISDPGLIPFLKTANIPFHISTQSNVLNKASALYWKNVGASRIVLARELSLPEIKEITSSVDLSFEAFVHGAMCISYSGRCLLSDYMSARSGNKGECAHTCRWNFGLNEEREPGNFYPIEEQAGKTYIMNSKDLCTIEILDQIINSGVTALKIEGRNKGVHYLSVVTKIYREAIDAILDEGANYKFRPHWQEELNKVSNREYTTGFYRDLEYSGFKQNYSEKRYNREYKLVGIVKEILPNHKAVVEIKNEFKITGSVSLFSPEKGSYLENSMVVNMENIQGQKESHVHTNRVVIMEFEQRVSAGSLVRVVAS